MRHLSSYKITAVVMVTFLIISCQKVIDIKLKEGERKYVIEGYITNQDTSRVLLSLTKSFSDSNGFAGVSGALVTIQDNSGATITLPETAPGVYESVSLPGITGHSYSLAVTIAGQTYTSESVMPVHINLDSIYVTERRGFDGKKRKVITAQYNDPAGKGNAYRFIRILNGVRDPRILVRDDNLTDGRTIRSELRGTVNTNDTVRIQMSCIDPAVYKFWFSLDLNGRGDDNSPAPANPITNIRGGAIGYFSAHTVQEKKLIVQ